MERARATSTPAAAISAMPSASRASAGNGKGGAVCEETERACGVFSTTELVSAMPNPAITNAPKAQRQLKATLISAPSRGPLKAATPHTADMMPNSCGQMARGNSRSTDTNASETSAPPPRPSTSRPARNIDMEGAVAQINAPIP